MAVLKLSDDSIIVATMESLFLPADATWIGALLLIIGGLFLAALVIGATARSVMPERYRREETGDGN